MPEAAPFFAALGDPVRWAIIARLCDDGPLPTMRLKEGMRLTRQAITKHLKLLEEVGLVRSERVGRDRSWKIDAQWEARLERLRVFVDEPS